MAVNTVHFDEIKKSIQDLVKIYKPKPEMADRFVNKFIKKYPVAKGFRAELIKIVDAEIKKLNG